MNLVWKDVGTTPNSQARVTGRFLDEEPLNVNTPAYPPSRASRGFKFVRGQMKKKRKPKDVPALRGEPSPTNLADTYGLNKTSNQPEMTTWSTCPIFRESDPLNIITESVDEINYCYEGELANELSEPDVTEVLQETSSDISWFGSPQFLEATLPTAVMLPPLPRYGDNPESVSPVVGEQSENNDFAITIIETDHNSPEYLLIEDEGVESWENSLTQGVRYCDIFQKYDPILSMYDKEFCAAPLTMDCNTNPFRVNPRHLNRSEFLLHAIMAVSSQHLAKKTNRVDLTIEMQNHRSMAMSSFTQALCRSDPGMLLETLMILISLELTQSAMGNWAIHLKGARKLLESAGALEKCRSSHHVRGQVAFLVWWDVILAFVSREDLHLPLAYLNALIDSEASAGNSFFVLNGCSIELVMAMARLSKLAAIFEKTQQMEWTIFDRTPVDQIITQVKTFVNTENVNLDACGFLEDDPNDARDRFHCIEAWRNAILLYTRRVFTRKQDGPGIKAITYLSRITLDHVRCISRRSFVPKQVLLPVFLAGAEVENDEDRQFAREFCRHWSVAARYHMFETTRVLLEEIWKDWDISTRDWYWWGLKVGGSHGQMFNEDDNAFATQVLLG